MKMLTKVMVLLLFVCSCAAFGNYHSRRRYDSSEEDNTVLRTYRRCMWEQSKFLPRRLMMLSICTNLFCENNQYLSRSKSFFSSLSKISKPLDCLDILPDECEQGDEDDLRYKPFPACCPVYCNLKRRMNRLKSMHMRHRRLINLQHSHIPQQGTGSTLLHQSYGINY